MVVMVVTLYLDLRLAAKKQEIGGHTGLCRKVIVTIVTSPHRRTDDDLHRHFAFARSR